jgi:hypothetical protein
MTADSENRGLFGIPGAGWIRLKLKAFAVATVVLAAAWGLFLAFTPPAGPEDATADATAPMAAALIHALPYSVAALLAAGLCFAVGERRRARK